jgi:hypothetical protein
VLARLVPGGKVLGREYVALNPTRTDRRMGSFKINCAPEAPGARVDPGPGIPAWHYFFRASFAPPMAFWILPSTLPLVPSAASLASPRGLAGRFLDGALGLLGRTGDTIFVHVAVSSFVDALLRRWWNGRKVRWSPPSPLPSSFLRMTVGSRGMFVGELAMFMSRGRVLLRVVVLAEIVMMGRLMVMMRGGVVVSGRLMVMLTRRMLR